MLNDDFAHFVYSHKEKEGGEVITIEYWLADILLGMFNLTYLKNYLIKEWNALYIFFLYIAKIFVLFKQVHVYITVKRIPKTTLSQDFAEYFYQNS